MDEQVDDPNGPWWEDGPLFSVRRTGSGITTLRPGAAPGRVTPILVVLWIATAAFWVGFAYLVLPSLLPGQVAPAAAAMREHWWWHVLVVAGIALLVGLGVFRVGRVAERAFGQQGVSVLVTASAVTLGFVIASGMHVAHVIDANAKALAGERPPPGTLADGTMLLIVIGLGALGVVACVLALPFAIRSTVLEQRAIARTRRDGSRYAGVLTDVEFRGERIGAFSQFGVTVRFATVTGEHALRARMATLPTRVPVAGTPVLVLLSPEVGALPAGDVPAGMRGILVEPDPSRPMVFEEDSRRFAATADGGS